MSRVRHNLPDELLPRRLSRTETFLRIFSDIRPGEGFAGLILMLNIFLVLAAYYLIKPVREGWLSISDIRGLSKIELKAYSSFAQSLVLLLVVPLYARLATRFSRRALIATVTLFFVSNLVIFWLLQPGLLADRFPHVGVAFYLWVGIFSATVVAQFWAFAADLYTDERGRRLLPLIAVGASSGAAVGSWFTGRFIKFDSRETFDLILLAIIPLLAALALSWIADRQGPVRKKGQEGHPTVHKGPAAPDPTGAYRLIFKTKYLLSVAILSLMVNWVNTNGENILFGTVQQALETEYRESGLTDPAAVTRFVKVGTTAFYSDLYMWVNLSALLIQAFLVSRMLKYGGFATILFLTPLVSLFSYSLMALFPFLAVIRIMKVAENSTNYSVNNTARHVLWLPLPPAMIYKAKTAIDTLFMRTGDGLAALTVLLGTQLFVLPMNGFLVVNVVLALIWGGVAWVVARENRRLVRASSGDERASL